MKRNSIRYQIILWFSAIILLVTTFLFFSFYFVTKQTLYDQVDQDLSSHEAKLVDIATRSRMDMHDAMLRQDLFNEFSEIPGMVVVVLDSNGDIVRSSLENNTKDSYRGIYNQVKNSSNAIYINENIQDVPMRFIAKSITANNNLLGVVLVAHPIDAIQKSISSLIRTLVLLYLVLIPPVLIVGITLSRRLLKPIANISEKMDIISLDKLNERISNPETGDELERLSLAFNRLLDRLQDAFVRERQFIGDVAHELKTPVATLRGGIELTLSRNRTEGEYRKAFQESLSDVNRLSTVIGNILDLAWLSSDNARKKPEYFNLSGNVDELKEIAIRLAAAKNITVESKIKPNVYFVGIEEKITRAILNIIDNAIKYTADKGYIKIELREKNGIISVSVKDNGIGISRNDLPHIFDRFYRGSKNDKTLGSGLGLAIAQGIIKAHKGTISVDSEVGKGSIFTIHLPKD